MDVLGPQNILSRRIPVSVYCWIYKHNMWAIHAVASITGIRSSECVALLQCLELRRTICERLAISTCLHLKLKPCYAQFFQSKQSFSSNGHS